ncbi:MAG: tetratricopeptide repeat protein [Chitinophagales bacterium]|nr:tetratricopeptide repeat protein [Chitinophagaceae bacterium]MCB9063674.1 tetratricopeptide repeat protein [Chitinophagales bacterium]
MNDSNPSLRHTLLHICILIIAVWAAYAKVFDAGFMSWDDMDYVFNTPDIRAINATTFANWWTEYYIGNYQPLPIFTYALDFLVGGEHAYVYHLDSILWHTGCAIMLYAFIKKLQGNALIALFVALLFALHPVQTESVSWIAARNKVMNGFFFFWAMYIYVGYVRKNNNKKLIWIYLLAIAAYLCKLTAVTLPFALLAVDIWMHRSLKDKRVWLEKLPLILLAIPIGVITLQAQKEVDFLNLHPDFTILHTIVFAGYAYVQYLVNLFVPVKLSVLYPYPTEIGAVHIIYSVIALAILIGGVIAYKKKQYVLAGGILFYTVNIAIVLQFVQFGEVLMADRYWYVACVGVWFVVVYYLYQFLQKKSSKSVAIGALAVLSLVYSIATYARNDIWLSELNFWESVTDNFPESAIAHSSLGGVYMEEGDYRAAKEHINKAISLDANNAKAWYNNGVIAMRQGNATEALSALNKAISIQETTKALFSRALLYQQTGDAKRALIDILKVLQQEPENARAHYIKADCLDQTGRLPEAEQEYGLAIRYEGKEPLYYLRRGLVYAKQRRVDDAMTDINKAISMNNLYTEAYYWRAMVKYRSGQNPCQDLQIALSTIKDKKNPIVEQINAAIQELCTAR